MCLLCLCGASDIALGSRRATALAMGGVEVHCAHRASCPSVFNGLSCTTATFPSHASLGYPVRNKVQDSAYVRVGNYTYILWYSAMQFQALRRYCVLRRGKRHERWE